MPPPSAPDQPDAAEPPLAVPLDIICNIVDKLREYESLNLREEAGDEQDDSANPLEGENVDALHEQENQYEFSPLLQELHAYIEGLPTEQQIDLVALMWLGRDNDTAGDWPSVRVEATRAHNARTARYLIGSPMAADFLAEGLSMLGLTCEPPASGSP